MGEEEDYDPLEDEGGEELEEAAGASRRRGRGASPTAARYPALQQALAQLVCQLLMA